MIFFIQIRRQLKEKKVKNIEVPKTTDGSILPAMIKAYGGPFWFAGILQIGLNLLTFATPLLLNELVIFDFF
jgi:ATP-binding cassette, subfamily C (CFTR/MRP), member 1